MSTIRRRDLRARPLSRSALKLLHVALDRRGELGFPRELIEGSGVRADYAWPALAQLLERGLLEKNALGHLKLTGLGRGYARRSA